MGLSFNDSHVVVRLSLGELIRTALPLTKWWHQYVWEPTASSGKRLDAGTIRSKATRRGLAQRLDAFLDGKPAGRYRFRDNAARSLKVDLATVVDY